MKKQLYKITDLKGVALETAIANMRKELDNEPNKAIRAAWAGYESNDELIKEYSERTLALYDSDGNLFENEDSECVDENLVFDDGNED